MYLFNFDYEILIIYLLENEPMGSKQNKAYDAKYK